MTFNKLKEKKVLVLVASVSLVSLILFGAISKKNSFHAESKIKSTKQEIVMDDIDTLIDESNMFGTLVMMKNGESVYTQSYGMADEKQKIKNNKDIIYPIASLQKSMTAVMIAQLISEDNLSYNTTIDAFYEDLDHADEITIRDLIEHTSGYVMPEIASDSVLVTEQEQLDNALKTSEYTDDRSYQYSNGNYSLLAGIIMELDDRPYEESLQTRILNPLNMKQTYLWNNLPSDAQLPKEYFYQENKNYQTDTLVYSEELMSTLLGAGNIYATAEDVARFETSLNNGVLLKDEEYLELFGIQHNDLMSRMGNISSLDTAGGYSSYVYGDITNQNVVVFLVNQSTSNDTTSLMDNLYQELLKF
ncbi:MULTISPECIES: serine hydrolase domain-containing protein [Vagococcus]|uniref:Beta-lactamase class C and other penicillin binding proteins n=1 Tax=Vagococcus fluvialis bH819 TaxID=1255619 RepID=A0A1X6WN01_9ENTE|nr:MULTISPECIES: serine hydrolase domain-containing protein [Vagococcus]SLM85612.1 Beta-lactamase class C and other penicillin binding proteins [Vagococcus fluvialis bH819]HCM89580.1 hypothetical protein [Vagococcus sp.]